MTRDFGRPQIHGVHGITKFTKNRKRDAAGHNYPVNLWINRTRAAAVTESAC